MEEAYALRLVPRSTAMTTLFGMVFCERLTTNMNKAHVETYRVHPLYEEHNKKTI